VHSASVPSQGGEKALAERVWGGGEVAKRASTFQKRAQTKKRDRPFGEYRGGRQVGGPGARNELGEPKGQGQIIGPLKGHILRGKEESRRKLRKRKRKEGGRKNVAVLKRRKKWEMAQGSQTFSWRIRVGISRGGGTAEK